MEMMPDSLDDTVYDRKSTSLRENQREFHINFAFSISLAPSLGLESFSPSNGASFQVARDLKSQMLWSQEPYAWTTRTGRHTPARQIPRT